MITDEASAKAWLQETAAGVPGAYDKLERLVERLVAESEMQNLVSAASLGEVWRRHVADSAQLVVQAREAPAGGEWLDLGTGAGFPGLVVAALCPGRAVTCVESRGLRSAWLETAAATMGACNVAIASMRVEALPARKVDVISARAFAPLDRLVSLAARFSTPDTLWLLPKGASAAQELAMLPSRWLHTFHVEHSLTDPRSGIVAGRLLGKQRAQR